MSAVIDIPVWRKVVVVGIAPQIWLRRCDELGVDVVIRANAPRLVGMTQLRKACLELIEAVFPGSDSSADMQPPVAPRLGPEAYFVAEQFVRMVFQVFVQGRAKVVLHDTAKLRENTRGRAFMADLDHEEVNLFTQCIPQALVVLRVESV